MLLSTPPPPSTRARLPVPVFSNAVILLALMRILSVPKPALNNGHDSGKSYVIFGKTDTNAIDLAKLGGNPKHTIDYLGDKNANTFTGTSRDEIFVAGAGNDTLTGNGGMDVFNAGLGTDSILIWWKHLVDYLD
jgi:hypothetical protein